MLNECNNKVTEVTKKPNPFFKTHPNKTSYVCCETMRVDIL